MLWKPHSAALTWQRLKATLLWLLNYRAISLFINPADRYVIQH
jgi:hypothetical protein